MVYLAVDVVVERSPHDCEVVVDADERVVDLFFIVGCAGSSGALGEGVERHLGGYAVAHQHQRATGQQEGTSRVKLVRRQIARVKTIMSEQQRSAAKS